GMPVPRRWRTRDARRGLEFSGSDSRVVARVTMTAPFTILSRYGDDRPRARGAVLPEPRGPLTESLFTALTGSTGSFPESVASRPLVDDALYGEDAPLALHVLYELHYQGFDGIDEDWEWDVGLLTLRRRRARAFLTR